MSQNIQRPWNANDAEELRIAQQLREYHHKALWEEEKHFTWLLSIILAAQIAVITQKASELQSRTQILMMLTIVGFVLVFLAFRVIRRESEFYVHAHEVFVTRFNTVFPEFPLEKTKYSANKDLLQLIGSVATYTSSIRDVFQFVFLIFGLVDIILFILAILQKI